MLCPYCGGDAAVLDSRTTSEGVRRRRNCGRCKRRFTTYEKVAAPAIKVSKRSGKSEAFSAEKLVKILMRVSRDRPGFGQDEATRLARNVEAQLIDSGSKSIASSKLALMVLDLLRDMDRLAYDRLAANYMNEAGLLQTTPGTTRAEGQLGLFVGEAKGGAKKS